MRPLGSISARPMTSDPFVFHQLELRRPQSQRDYRMSPRLAPLSRRQVEAARQQMSRSGAAVTAGGLPPSPSLRRKGRAPSLTKRTTLGTDARAFMARLTSDVPPGAAGFGSHVTTEGDLLGLWSGSTVPKRLLPTEEELGEVVAAAAIIAKCNESEEAANDCLLSLMSQASKTMEKAESKLIEEAKSMAVSDSDNTQQPGGGGRKGRRRTLTRRITEEGAELLAGQRSPMISP